MRIVTLIPLTKRAKQIVKSHGERWEVLQMLPKVLFNDGPGPWMLVTPVNEQRIAYTPREAREDSASRWIHAHFDGNFKVAP